MYGGHTCIIIVTYLFSQWELLDIGIPEPEETQCLVILLSVSSPWQLSQTHCMSAQLVCMLRNIGSTTLDKGSFSGCSWVNTLHAAAVVMKVVKYYSQCHMQHMSKL